MRLVSCWRLLWCCVSVLLAAPSAHAQLLSCAEIGCPTDAHARSMCQINGSHITTLGFNSFQTSLATEPLSWTVGYTRDLDEPSKNSTRQRLYYLGTPPTLNLSSISSVSGCALSFVGVQAFLKFNVMPGFNESGEIRVIEACPKALGAGCVPDLLEQALNYTSELSSNRSFECSSLADILKNDPPASCPAMGTWGDIHVNELTGPRAASKIDIGNCNPAFGQDYDVRVVDQQTNFGQHNFFEAVTPILTIFAPVNNPHDSDVGPILTIPQAYLSCLKPVSDDDPSAIPPFVGGQASKSLSGYLKLWSLSSLFLWFVLS